MSNIITLQEVFASIPERKKNSSKYDYGKLLAICGSTYYRGAAFLSCAGALRSGVGIITLASTEKVISCVSASLPECTFLPLKESENGTIDANSLNNIGEISKKYNAILIGCGLSIDDSTRELVKNIVKHAECQLVIDADAINILSECPDLIKQTKMPPIITPHFNEMARLFGVDRKIIEISPEDSALEFSKKYNCITVLKSHITYITTPDGKVAVNSQTGNSGLAKGGSGDVLAGMIASFCAQKINPFDASKCGVFLHGKAADRCAERLSKQSMLPSDILTDLSTMFSE